MLVLTQAESSPLSPPQRFLATAALTVAEVTRGREKMVEINVDMVHRVVQVVKRAGPVELCGARDHCVVLVGVEHAATLVGKRHLERVKSKAG